MKSIDFLYYAIGISAMLFTIFNFFRRGIRMPTRGRLRRHRMTDVERLDDRLDQMSEGMSLRFGDHETSIEENTTDIEILKRKTDELPDPIDKYRAGKISSDVPLPESDWMTWRKKMDFIVTSDKRKIFDMNLFFTDDEIGYLAGFYLGRIKDLQHDETGNANHISRCRYNSNVFISYLPKELQETFVQSVNDVLNDPEIHSNTEEYFKTIGQKIEKDFNKKMNQ